MQLKGRLIFEKAFPNSKIEIKYRNDLKTIFEEVREIIIKNSDIIFSGEVKMLDFVILTLKFKSI